MRSAAGGAWGGEEGEVLFEGEGFSVALVSVVLSERNVGNVHFAHWGDRQGHLEVGSAAIVPLKRLDQRCVAVDSLHNFKICNNKIYFARKNLNSRYSENKAPTFSLPLTRAAACAMTLPCF